MRIIIVLLVPAILAGLASCKTAEQQRQENQLWLNLGEQLRS